MNNAQPATPPGSRQRRSWATFAAGCALLAACLLCAGALAGGYVVTQRRSPAAQPAVEYVLDASPRMALLADTGSGSRLAVAQSVLAEIVRPADPAVAAALRVFGTGAVSQGCNDTDLLVPLAPASQAKISASLLTVSPAAQADAALGAAVVAALRDLAAMNGPRALVVVTGGSDSCNEQAGALIAAEAKKNGIDYQLFVIGFLVPDDQGSAISGLVDSGNGHFIRVSSRDQLRTVLQAIQQYVDHPTTTTVAAVLATVAAVPSQTPTSTPTLTSRQAVTPSPTPNRAPKVNNFLARFDAVKRSTFYSVTVSLETDTTPGAPPALTYSWTNSNPCGQFSGVSSPIAEWHHPDVPGSCPNEPVHQGVITVVVSNAYGAVKCEYDGGSAPGNIAQCQDVPR